MYDIYPGREKGRISTTCRHTLTCIPIQYMSIIDKQYTLYMSIIRSLDQLSSDDYILIPKGY